MFGSLPRHREAEWMDAHDADPAGLAASLRFIRRVNHWLGYTRLVVEQLEQFSKYWRAGETIRIADFATGSADIPLAILAWAERRGVDMRIVGIDRHPATAAIAAGAAHPKLSIVRGDALDPPLVDNSVDYAITSMFLHHLSVTEATTVLRQMNRVARRGIIASDLLRHRRALAWITLFTLTSHPMVKHDARASVWQAFTGEEVRQLRDAAGVGYAAYRQCGRHRFMLAGERRLIPSHRTQGDR